jgi:hypothetical protein
MLPSISETKTLDEVNNFLFSGEVRKGTLPPINDHRFAAGLLFARLNDGTTRVLKNLHRERPHIEITWRRDRWTSEPIKIPVTETIVRTLLHGDFVECVPESSSCHEMQLSRSGKRMVVTEWFITDRSEDRIVAGACIDLKDKTERWN